MKICFWRKKKKRTSASSKTEVLKKVALLLVRIYPLSSDEIYYLLHELDRHIDMCLKESISPWAAITFSLRGREASK